MKKDIGIIGDGIVGLLLAWQLKDNARVTIYGDNQQNIASLYGAAVINPMAYNEKSNPNFTNIFEHAVAVYESIGTALNKNYIKLFHSITNHYKPNKDNYISAHSDAAKVALKPLLLHQDSLWEVAPLLKVDTQLTNDLRTYFRNKNQLITSQINKNNTPKHQYLIYCEGASVRQNELFSNIKFTANKGNIIIATSATLPEQYIYDIDLKIVPLGNQTFWIGSDHVWQYHDLSIDPNFRIKVEQMLAKNFNCAFNILQHIAIERPTIAGQQPIFQWHKEYKNIAVLNGFGTKGFSNAPFYTQKVALEIINS